MELVQTVADIEANIGQLETYLNSPQSPEDQSFARCLIGAGRCFVALRRGDHLFFAPSRFVGYRNNSRVSHQNYPDKDGKETNPAIGIALNRQLMENTNLDEEYRQFCARIGARPSNHQRKYWVVGDEPALDSTPPSDTLWKETLRWIGARVDQIIVAVIIAVLTAAILTWLGLKK